MTLRRVLSVFDPVQYGALVYDWPIRQTIVYLYARAIDSEIKRLKELAKRR